MGVDKRRPRAQWLALVVIPLLPIVGCFVPSDNDQAATASVLASLMQGAEVRVAGDGANEDFAAATTVPLAPGEPQAVRAKIENDQDVDVYEVGEVFRGDRLLVEVAGDDLLDATAAVFDADFNLMYSNDDRDYFGGLVDPLIDFVARRDSERCYVVVASSPGSRSQGAYTLATAVIPDVEVAAPQPQVVVLNLEGADGVEFGGRRPVDIPPFDAASISPTLEGKSDELIELVLEKVRADFATMNVEVYSSREGVAIGPDATTIHFGAYDRALLGVAENVDEFNERTVQEGIIFTDTFAIFEVLEPSLEEYAQALANVTSHEIGHLLGLVHTADVRGVMDVTASLRYLMLDQAFARSPLEDGVFPVGYQDDAVTLAESVGGDVEAFRAVNQVARNAVAAKSRFDADRFAGVGDLPRGEFARCMCRECEISRLKRQRADAKIGY